MGQAFNKQGFGFVGLDIGKIRLPVDSGSNKTRGSITVENANHPDGEGPAAQGISGTELVWSALSPIQDTGCFEDGDIVAVDVIVSYITIGRQPDAVGLELGLPRQH